VVIIVTPDALIHYYYMTSGGIVIGGSAIVFMSRYYYDPSGGIVIGGWADIYADRWQWTPWGGIVIGGTVGFFYWGEGGIVIGGSAIAVNRYRRPDSNNLICLTEGGYIVPHSCLVRAQVGICPMTARREYTPNEKKATGQSFYAVSEAYVSAMTVCQVESEYYHGLRARSVSADCAVPEALLPAAPRVSFKKVTPIR
jgi:hypothetical protein